MGKLLPDVLAQAGHIAALDQLVELRLSNLDLSGLLPYMVDTVPSAALPYLASQMDVLGYKGMKFAATDADQRALIKQALILHQKKGTPWSIKRAVTTAHPEVQNVTIQEGITFQYNGQFRYNHTVTYGAGWWAIFRVIVAIDPTVAITGQLSSDITNLILEYKNCRSHLLDLTFQFVETEICTPTETDGIGPGPIIDTVGRGMRFNGKHLYNGGALYAQGYESINVVIT